MCTGKILAGQLGRQHRAAGCLTGLEAFGQSAIEDTLTVSRRLAVGNAKGIDELLNTQAHQFARCRRGPKNTDERCAMPTALFCGGESQSACDIETQGHSQHKIAAADAPEALGRGEAGKQRRRPRMNTPAMVQRIVEIQGMAHGRIDHGGLGGWHPITQQ